MQQILGCLLFVWILIEYRIMLNQNKRPKKQDNRIIFLFAVLIVLFVVISVTFSTYFDIGNITIHKNLFYISGVVLMVYGIFFRQYSMHILGKYYVATVQVQEQQKIIKEGPFSLLRHPCYAGFIYTLWGFGVAILNWAILIMIVLFSLLVFLIQIHIEEKKLLESFGEEYKEYAQRTKKILPFIL